MAEVAFREASPPNNGHFIEFSLRVTNIPPALFEALSHVSWKSIQPSKTMDLTDLKSCRGNVSAVGIQRHNCRDVASRGSGFWRSSRQCSTRAQTLLATPQGIWSHWNKNLQNKYNIIIILPKSLQWFLHIMNTPLMTNIGTSRSQSWISEARVLLISCCTSENLIPWATILAKAFRWHSPSPLSDPPSVHSHGQSILLGDQQHFGVIAIQGFLSCRSSILSPAWWSTCIEAMPLPSHFLNLTLSTRFSLCTSSLSWSPSSILKSAALTCHLSHLPCHLAHVHIWVLTSVHWPPLPSPFSSSILPELFPWHNIVIQPSRCHHVPQKTVLRVLWVCTGFGLSSFRLQTQLREWQPNSVLTFPGWM